jgi:hypothetical protein
MIPSIRWICRNAENALRNVLVVYQSKNIHAVASSLLTLPKNTHKNAHVVAALNPSLTKNTHKNAHVVALKPSLAKNTHKIDQTNVVAVLIVTVLLNLIVVDLLF